MTSQLQGDNSLETLLGLIEAQYPNYLEILRASNESAFIAAIDGALESAIRKIESSANRYSVLNEPSLSQLLADLLSYVCRATAETNNNGHVDVVIESARGTSWKYIGECKIFDGNQYHLDGCNQLLSYCAGRDRRSFCLEFFKTGDMYKKLAALRVFCDAAKPLEQEGSSADHGIAGAFVTTHKHISGNAIQILHVGCSIVRKRDGS